MINMREAIKSYMMYIKGPTLITLVVIFIDLKTEKQKGIDYRQVYTLQSIILTRVARV